MAIEREIVVKNREGLHFRPIMQFVDTASRFTSRVAVRCNDREADGRSPMELLMLVATQATRVVILTDGPDEAAAAEALAKLFETGFGEA
ncbi:Phosphocarrier protein HPr [Phycisphaerae bacterium RAS1]|nr:Phosphocarrier protein HPr [Phycisphaerae bacterium RAS1]